MALVYDFNLWTSVLVIGIVSILYDFNKQLTFDVLKASASAQMWASTHNDTLKEKMSALGNALSACPDKMGTRYLSAFPPELFDCFEAIKPVWAPYYTIDKV